MVVPSLETGLLADQTALLHDNPARLAPCEEPPNALMAINHELRRVEALAASVTLDPADTELYESIVKARLALDELADALEERSA